MILTGRYSAIYDLPDTPLAQGGEGAVYEIKGMPDKVAKIYHKAVDQERIEKLKAMIALNISPYIDGVVRLSWPLDILYENGCVKGCVMPKISDQLKLLNVQRQKDPIKDKSYPDFNWKYSIQIAYNYALMVRYMHECGIIIGDFNPNNFVIDKDHGGAVVFLDCDSFDFKFNGKHFNCKVAFDEVLAPELQNAGLLSKATFTKEADCFSLAVHIFRLLMNNQDPFGSVNVGRVAQSSTGNCNNLPIVKGECLYVNPVLGKDLPPKSLPFSFLPPDIRDLFKRVFDYNDVTSKRRIKLRPTAAEWVTVLYKYAEPGNMGTKLKECKKNSRHVYAYHLTECPWCALEKKTNPSPTRQQPKPTTIKTPTQTTQYTKAPTQTTSYTKTTSTTSNPPGNIPIIINRGTLLLYIAWLLTGVAGAYMFAAPIKTIVGSLWALSTVRLIMVVIAALVGFKGASGSAKPFRSCKSPLRYYVKALINLVVPLIGFVAIHYIFSNIF